MMQTATRHRTSRPVRDLCLAPGRTVDAPVTLGGRYGRMFPDLPAATFDDDRLLALGIEGSICHGGVSDADSHIEAGQPFFGQCLAHDLTADRSPLRAQADAMFTSNFLDTAAERVVRSARRRGETALMRASEADLDNLAGFVAFDANHTAVRARQRLLDSANFRIEEALRKAYQRR